jgi:tellurite resistance protein TerC
LHATPLLMALICIEFMDVVFALDSVPAVFAITTDPFVVYTSNIFAILGLRTMYFAVTAMLDRFKYIKYSLALVLVFIGGKVFYSGFIEKINPLVSLTITLVVLLGGIIFSLIKTRNEEKGHL